MTRADLAALRVLHVSHTALVSGAERSLLDLAAGLREYAVPRVASPPGELRDRAQELMLETVALREVDLTFKRNARATATALIDAALASRELFALMDADACDVVHANSVRAALIARPAATARRVPLVMHVRDVLPQTRAGAAVRHIATRAADRIVAISCHVSHALLDGLPARLTPKVTVVDNPIDLERFDTRDEGRRRDGRMKLGIEDERPVLTIVGQITPWKGHDVAVRALAHLRDARPDAVLLVVGEVKFASSATTFDNRGFRRELDELTDRLKLPQDAVRFLGEREDVPDILAAADLLLAPSHVEPFGRSIAEAMAVGVPVIATAIGGPREFIEHGRTGWLVDPHDAGAWGELAGELLSERDRSRAVAEAGRDHVRSRFSCERHAKAMLEVLTEAYRSKGGGPRHRREARI
jgi:glycosyltransferase involved in cell wall biosynthesis